MGSATLFLQLLQDGSPMVLLFLCYSLQIPPSYCPSVSSSELNKNARSAQRAAATINSGGFVPQWRNPLGCPWRDSDLWSPGLSPTKKMRKVSRMEDAQSSSRLYSTYNSFSWTGLKVIIALLQKSSPILHFRGLARQEPPRGSCRFFR